MGFCILSCVSQFVHFTYMYISVHVIVVSWFFLQYMGYVPHEGCMYNTSHGKVSVFSVPFRCLFSRFFPFCFFPFRFP